MKSNPRYLKYSYVIIYLLAIVAANLLVAAFGPGMSIVNSFLFIGLDITTRDKLHESWYGRGLVWKMGALIASGSIISFGLNRGTGMIALASFVSFALAALSDTLVYHLLYRYGYLVKVNGSNVVSSLVDSIVFPTIAFGGFLPLVSLGQFLAKTLGGFVWSIILNRRRL